MDQPYVPRRSPPGQLFIPTTTAAPGTAAAALDAASPLAVADAMSQLLQDATPSGASQGCSSVNSPCRVDPVKGNLVAQIRTPSLGPADPQPMLTYHSDSLNPDAFGKGWSGLFAAKVVGPTSISGHNYATVYRGDGSVIVYQQTTIFDPYAPLGGTSSANKLTQNADGSWTEMQGNGLSFVYQHATANFLTRIVGISGGIWTMAYDGFFNNTAVIDPFLRRTSFSWDSAMPANLRRVTDRGGRITTFSIDPASSTLRRVTTPELCITSMNYDSAGRLLQWIDPLGNRTSYSYNSSSQVTRVVSPLGEVTTYVYRSQAVAKVDPLGHITTWTNSAEVPLSLSTVQSITDAVGNVTQYRWTGDTLPLTTFSAVIDPKGNRTTSVYMFGGQTQQQLTAVTQPVSGAYNYGYGGGQPAPFDTVTSVTDQRGNTTYLRWDSSVNRTAMIDPYGNRTSYAYNSMGQITQVTDALGHSTQTRYDAFSQMIAEIDATGNRTSYAYSAYGQLSRVIDPLGNITSTQYDLVNRPLSVTDPLGNRTSYAWDLDSRLASVTDPLGHVTARRFDADSRLIATIDPLGHRTSIAFDLASNPIRVTDPLGRIATTVYDAVNRPVVMIDPTGKRTSMAYDPASNLIRVVNALGQITTTVFDAQNRPIATIDPVLNRTSVVYDNASNIVRIVDPLGHITTAAYDLLNRPARTVDPLGNITSMAFDAANRQINLANALSFRTTLGYDAASRLLTVTDPLGYRTSSAYDRSGRLKRVQNALGSIYTTTYDADSRVVATIDPLNNRTSLGYDAASRLVRMVDPLGHIGTSTYDAADRLAALIDPLGNRTSFGYDAGDENISVTDALGHRTTTTYDRDGRPLATINALGFRTSLVYDAIGEVLAVIDARGNRTSSTFDPAGRLTGMTDPLSNQTTYRYDAASRNVMRIDGRGLRTSYLYDADDRLTGLKYQDGTRATMTYDAIGRRTVLGDWTGRYSATYDADNRLTRRVGPTGIPITYAYDAIGRRAHVGQPTGRFTYLYDAANRLSRLTNPEGDRTSYQYDPASRVTAYRMANGTRASYSYDNANRVLRLANLGPGAATLSSSTYKYDAAYNRTRVAGSDGSVTSWTYDTTYQLTGENRTGTNAYGIAYTFDGAGNRLTRWDGTTLETLTCDAANQMTAILAPGSPATYAYDRCGNLMRHLAPGQVSTYTWDGENRMVGAALTGGVVNSFTFNADGQRVGKTDQGGVVNYVWDRQNVLIEANASNVIQAVHTLKPAYYGNQVSQRRSGATSYYHFDALGSTLQLTGAAGTATDSYLYRAFGDLVTSSGTTVNPYQYVGRKGYIYDSDLFNHQVRARRYAPGMGRWWSRDPIGFAGGDPNLYRYVGNSSTDATDPAGLYRIIPYVSWLTSPWTAAEIAVLNAQLASYSTMITRNIAQITAFKASLTPCQRRAIGSELDDALKILRRMSAKLASNTPLYVTHSPKPKGDSGQHYTGWFANTIWLNDSADWMTETWILFHELSHDSGTDDGYINIPGGVGALISRNPWDPWDAANLQSLNKDLFNITQLHDALLTRANKVCRSKRPPARMGRVR